MDSYNPSGPASLATPRVNAQFLSRFISKNVRLVGKVHKLVDPMDGLVELETSDGRLVRVQSSSIASGTAEAQALYQPGNLIEIVGQVRPDGTIGEFNAINLGTNFDMANYEKLVQLINGKFSSLFM